MFSLLHGRKIDPKHNYVYVNTNMIIYIFTHIYRENMLEIVGLFDGTRGGGKRKRMIVDNTEIHCTCVKR
jgi:hypothetical protein